MEIKDIILHFVFSFIATAGFCIMFNIPKRHIIFCGLLGVVSWFMYILLHDPAGEVIATFVATCTIVLLSRIFSVIRKCPMNVLLIAGIIPLAPGSAIYYTAYYFVTNDMEKAGEYGFLTLKIAFAIVLGIIVVIAIPVSPLKKLLKQKAEKKK